LVLHTYELRVPYIYDVVLGFWFWWEILKRCQAKIVCLVLGSSDLDYRTKQMMVGDARSFGHESADRDSVPKAAQKYLTKAHAADEKTQPRNSSYQASQ
jgi:hypothetical protein